MAKSYYVYIMSSESQTLYVGMTNDLERRVAEHKQHAVAGFTDRYNVTRLVHFEQTSDVHAALAREKELKHWRREKKKRLIEAENPFWDDLTVT